MKWKKAESFKIILKRVKKEVNGFTVREIETVPKTNYEFQDSTIEYGVYEDTPITRRYGTFTSNLTDKREVKLGFKTLAEAVSYAETLELTD